jgi:hypothetical protein
MMRNAASDESGQVLVLTAICITVLVGFLACSVDVGMLLYQKRLAQTAADCAAMAGISELNYAVEDGTTVTLAAQAAAAANGFTDGSNGTTVTVNVPPHSGPHAGNTEYLEVIVQRNVPTPFMGLFGFHTVSVSGRAVGGFAGGEGCLYTLGTSGIDISVNGTAQASVPDCDIYVDSTTSNAITVAGGATVTAKMIAVAAPSLASTTGLSPTPVTGVPPVSDPLAYLPEPTVPSNCSSTVLSSGTANYGCYAGISINGNNSLTLNPGLYIINGNISIGGSATVSGTGVTIYTNGSVSMNGNAPLTLSAPTSGTYNGILYFQSRSDSNSFSLTGTSGSSISGIFYAPLAPASYQGTSGATVNASFVVNTMSLGGTPVLHSYSLDSGPGNGPLGSSVVVE